MKIVEFLWERIEEEERDALSVDPETNYTHVRTHPPADKEPHYFQDPSAQKHFERHNPARVIAECAAKRAIIREALDQPVLATHGYTTDIPDTRERGGYREHKTRQEWTTPDDYRQRFVKNPPTPAILKELAAIYADHPDYQENGNPPHAPANDSHVIHLIHCRQNWLEATPETGRAQKLLAKGEHD